MMLTLPYFSSGLYVDAEASENPHKKRSFVNCKVAYGAIFDKKHIPVYQPQAQPVAFMMCSWSVVLSV